MKDQPKKNYKIIALWDLPKVILSWQWYVKIQNELLFDLPKGKSILPSTDDDKVIFSIIKYVEMIPSLSWGGW